jgi:hypothetical protein
MQDPASELRRIPLLRRSVNRASRYILSIPAPATATPAMEHVSSLNEADT